MYVGNQADLLAGEGNYVLLSKEGDEWKVTKTFQAWIS
jgi:pantothenate kinase